MHSRVNCPLRARVQMHITFALALLLSSLQEAPPLNTFRGLPSDLYGIQAPDFRARSIDGLEYRLASLRGRYVLLDFWGVGCAPCRDAMPALEAMHQDYKDRGLVILGIDIGEDRRTVETFLKKTPASYPIVVDTAMDVAKLFHVSVVPTFILIDPDGKIVDGRVGFVKTGPDSDANIGETELREMLRRLPGNDLGK